MSVYIQLLFGLLNSPFIISSSVVLEETHAPKVLVEDTATSSVAEDENQNNGGEVYHPQDEEEGSVIDEEVAEPPTDLSQNEIVTVHDSTSAAQDDAPRRSYASIVSLFLYFLPLCYSSACLYFIRLIMFIYMKVMKSNVASGHVYVPSRAARVASAKSNEQWSTTAKSTPVPESFAPIGDSAPESSDLHEEGIHWCSLTCLAVILFFRSVNYDLDTSSSLAYLFHLKITCEQKRSKQIHERKGGKIIEVYNSIYTVASNSTFKIDLSVFYF